MIKNIYSFLKSKYNKRVNNDVNSFFYVNSFLPKKSINSFVKKKIKIRFLYRSYATLNVIYPIIDEFSKDDNYDVKLIVSNSNTDLEAIKAATRRNLSCFLERDYKVDVDKPDILIVSHPREDAFLGKEKQIRENVKLIIIVTETLIRYEENLDKYWKWAIGYKRFLPDVFIYDKLMFNELCKTNIKDKLIAIGNAKFDSIYELKKEKVKYDKLKNLKVVLWATDHGIYHYEVSNDISFDLYAKDIIDYCATNDIGLIFRPHPTFISEMFKFGFWNEEDYLYMKRYFENSSNMIFDDSDDYSFSMVACDAILTDPFCDITCAAIPLNKPIGIIYRNNNIRNLHKEYSDTSYRIDNKNELFDFLKMVKEGEDYKRFQRMLRSKEMYYKFDGKNGNRIYKYIDDLFNSVYK